MAIQPVRRSFAETARQRRHERINDEKRQLRVKSGAGEGRTSNWSEGGFLSSGLGGYSKDDLVEGTIERPGGRRTGFSGRVARVEEDGMRAVQLVSLDSAALLAIQSADSEDKTPGSSASSRARSLADIESAYNNPNS